MKYDSRQILNAVVLLPIDLRRYIVRLLPRTESAELIKKSYSKIRLTYVRIKQFTDNSFNKYNVWNDLNPSHLESVFYGDEKHIVRINISKGQIIKLKSIGVLPSGIRLWW
tara:strand:+ start:20157 stop:20489 length:333 start_codon:yes stop_codon:yes gene_type:complete